MSQVDAIIYAHARLDELDLDARPKWVGISNKQTKSVVRALGNSETKPAISIKLARPFFLFFSSFYMTLTFPNSIFASDLCFV